MAGTFCVDTARKGQASIAAPKGARHEEVGSRSFAIVEQFVVPRWGTAYFVLEFSGLTPCKHTIGEHTIGAVHLSADPPKNASNSEGGQWVARANGWLAPFVTMGAIHLLPIINLSADPQENAAILVNHWIVIMDGWHLCVVTIVPSNTLSIHRRMPAILTERSHWMAGTFCVSSVTM